MRNEPQKDEYDSIINNGKIRGIVATKYCRLSGEHGSPMFSRVGKYTTIDKVEFHNAPAVQVDSTFEQ